MKRLIRSGLAVAGAAGALSLLAACTSSGSTAGSTPTVTRTATVPPTTVTASPTPTASAPASGSAGGAPTRCTTDELTGQVGGRNGAQPGTGNGASQQHVAIILTNTGSTACTLQGWPGVSLVGKGNGTQLGAAARLNRATPHATVTISAGSKVQAPLDYTDAAAFPSSECQLVTADGLRVYPPGSTTSLFIADKLQACMLTTHSLMSVGAFVTYP